ncbi:unnamed protein product [Didymodactylos carnosus]|uniref:SWIM-type domain-containing protein n=1 Tax=Didymodactylos carnosus TaxID=1234261 RepID=A0A8S2EIC1_9BILA|nr:unnamed protein product [Didymodactylos carnosus]CAF3992054.1 unnamed protein product [Didymodactylos carnosus]
MNTSTWVNLLHSMIWDSYDHFKDWLHSARLLDFSRFLPTIFCTCRYGLKEFACVHAVGMMMLWGTRQMPQALGKHRGKGHPKRVRYSISEGKQMVNETLTTSDIQSTTGSDEYPFSVTGKRYSVTRHYRERRYRERHYGEDSFIGKEE